jgi:hypothetical protein
MMEGKTILMVVVIYGHWLDLVAATCAILLDPDALVFGIAFDNHPWWPKKLPQIKLHRHPPSCTARNLCKTCLEVLVGETTIATSHHLAQNFDS